MYPIKLLLHVRKKKLLKHNIISLYSWVISSKFLCATLFIVMPKLVLHTRCNCVIYRVEMESIAPCHDYYTRCPHISMVSEWVCMWSVCVVREAIHKSVSSCVQVCGFYSVVSRLIGSYASLDTSILAQQTHFICSGNYNRQQREFILISIFYLIFSHR